MLDVWLNRVLLVTQGFEEKFEEYCKGEGDGRENGNLYFSVTASSYRVELL